MKYTNIICTQCSFDIHMQYANNMRALHIEYTQTYKQYNQTHTCNTLRIYIQHAPNIHIIFFTRYSQYFLNVMSVYTHYTSTIHVIYLQHIVNIFQMESTRHYLYTQYIRTMYARHEFNMHSIYTP